MKTEYLQTDFPVITDSCRESFRIRGRARGVHLVPLAKGETPAHEMGELVPLTPGNAVNDASADELVEHCGIGQELAGAIIAHRETYGPFVTASALEAIPGIGEKTAEKIWAY